MPKAKSLVPGLLLVAVVWLAWWALATGRGPFGGGGRERPAEHAGGLDASGPSLEGSAGGHPPDPRKPGDGVEAGKAAEGLQGRKVVLDVRDPGRLSVAGARVRLMQWESSFFTHGIDSAAETVTDERGEAVLVVTAGMDLSQDGWLLYIDPPAGRTDVLPLRRSITELESGTLNLPRAFALAGRVHTREQAAVIGAAVSVAGGSAVMNDRTDTAGHFRIAGLTPGTWRLFVNLPGLRREETALFDVEAGAESLDLEVDAGEVLAVSLRDFQSVDRQFQVRLTELPRDDAAAPKFVAETIPADGQLRFYGLRIDREYALWWGPDSGGSFAYRATVDPTAGRVVLERRQGADLKGTFRLDGAPVPQAILVTARGPGFELEATCPKPGSFLIRGLPDVPLHVTAGVTAADGTRWLTETSARAGGDDLALVLKKQD